MTEWRRVNGEDDGFASCDAEVKLNEITEGGVRLFSIVVGPLDHCCSCFHLGCCHHGSLRGFLRGCDHDHHYTEPFAVVPEAPQLSNLQELRSSRQPNGRFCSRRRKRKHLYCTHLSSFVQLDRCGGCSLQLHRLACYVDKQAVRIPSTGKLKVTIDAIRSTTYMSKLMTYRTLGTSSPREATFVAISNQSAPSLNLRITSSRSRCCLSP